MSNAADASARPGPDPDLNKISATIIICERILEEKDGVMSTVRIGDVFTLNQVSNTPDERKTLALNVLLNFRQPSGDGKEHRLELWVLRPSGEAATIVDDTPLTLESDYPDAHVGKNVLIQLGLNLKESGVHQLVAVLDGAQVARAIFTLRRDEGAEVVR